MIRALLLNAFIFMFTIILCAFAILISVFDRNGKWIHSLIEVPWARVILRLSGIKVNAVGLENINAGKSLIFMSNHQSYFDIFTLFAFLPVNFKFIMKQELMKIPFFGFTMKRAAHIGIERNNPRKAVMSMNRAVRRINSGTSVLIFPEGTRSIDGRLLSFKRGGFSLALKSGCDIVPVAIRGSYRIVPKGSLRINKGCIDMFIGEPISVKEYTRKNVSQLMEKVREAMLRHLEDGP